MIASMGLCSFLLMVFTVVRRPTRKAGAVKRPEGHCTASGNNSKKMPDGKLLGCVLPPPEGRGEYKRIKLAREESGGGGNAPVFEGENTGGLPPRKKRVCVSSPVQMHRMQNKICMVQVKAATPPDKHPESS